MSHSSNYVDAEAAARQLQFAEETVGKILSSAVNFVSDLQELSKVCRGKTGSLFASAYETAYSDMKNVMDRFSVNIPSLHRGILNAINAGSSKTGNWVTVNIQDRTWKADSGNFAYNGSDTGVDWEKGPDIIRQTMITIQGVADGFDSLIRFYKQIYSLANGYGMLQDSANASAKMVRDVATTFEESFKKFGQKMIEGIGNSEASTTMSIDKLSSAKDSMESSLKSVDYTVLQATDALVSAEDQMIGW